VLGEAAPALLGAAHEAVQPGREPSLDARLAEQALVDVGRERSDAALAGPSPFTSTTTPIRCAGMKAMCDRCGAR